jgi:hypothetical protein
VSPVWKPVNTEFYGPRMPVEIVDFGLGGDGELLRSILESLNCVVLSHWPGAPGDFLKVIGQGDSCAPYLIVSGHGDEGGLIFGEYADCIDTSMLVDGHMPAECIRRHARLPGSIVISTCCSGGERQLAEAFLAGGLKAYIGAVEAVAADAVPLFVSHFFYQLPRVRHSVHRAWQHAASYDEESRLFALYDRGGGHRVK